MSRNSQFPPKDICTHAHTHTDMKSSNKMVWIYNVHVYVCVCVCEYIPKYEKNPVIYLDTSLMNFPALSEHRLLYLALLIKAVGKFSFYQIWIRRVYMWIKSF